MGKFDKAKAERYINACRTKADVRYHMFADEVLGLYLAFNKNPYLAIAFAFDYGFAKGKRAQAAAQRRNMV